MREYIDDCRTILNNFDVFDNASEMAEAIENSRKLSKAEFNNLCLPIKDYGENVIYGLTPSGIAWAYDDNKDIHYFYN